MNRLSILASMLAMACLPMMAQKTGSKVLEKPDPNFRFISASDSRTWKEMRLSKTSTERA